jgi:alpha-N-arabinofuranosidase
MKKIAHMPSLDNLLSRVSRSKHYVALFFAMCVMSCGVFGDDNTYRRVGDKVNQAEPYPVVTSKLALKCTVDLSREVGSIDPRIFGTNLEWFNDAGGLASEDLALKKKITKLAKEQGVTVMRYPGGTLADFYNWRDGIGPVASRPKRKHPTDTGSSFNNFGSPEFFQFLKDTQSEALITVNVGTGTAKSAADWVAYTNKPQHAARARDGFKEPLGVKLWEIGNELYLPGNPGEQKITITPEVYASRYLEFSRAIKAVDPTVTTVAIGVAKSHIGPDTEYPNWTKVLLERAANEIDMIAVHNAYFPMLYTERQPHVKDVYPALMASPEAVDKSLVTLEKLIAQYEGNKKIGIAVTEWGGLFSLPEVDNYWVDHVKTMGTGIYVARMLQVLMSHERVQLANYFKLTDRSFMGWINYAGEPKVPFWVFALYANHVGDKRLSSNMLSPTYDAPAIGIMAAQKGVPEVTAVASQNSHDGKIYVNFVNRSITTRYPITLDFLNGKVKKQATVLTLQTKELTAHNGRDIPPEWPYELSYEPYSSATPNSIKIKENVWNGEQPLTIAPFSVMTIVFDMQK